MKAIHPWHRVACDYNEKFLYAHYRKHTPRGTIYDITRQEHYAILKWIWGEIVRLMIEELAEVKLSPDIGTFHIKKFKPNARKIKKAINWGQWRRTGKRLPYLNEHTNGYRFSIAYQRPRNVRYAKYYKFKAMSKVKRRLSTQIFENGFDCFVDNELCKY